MRSAEFPKHKEDPRELRILVLGDSIINGGALTDQHDLPTELLRRDLTEQLKRPVVVGNVSAGSWGPPNLLAYVKEFGTFDADVAIFVISSHDATDVPTFAPLDPDSFPESKPPCALWEAITRYLPRYLPGGLKRHAESRQPPSDADREKGLAAFDELLQIFKDAGATEIVLQHETRAELDQGVDPDHDRIAEVGMRAGAKVVQLAPKFKSSIDHGIDPYRDDGLHPNTAGQRLIYEALREAVMNAIKGRRELDKAALRTYRFEILTSESGKQVSFQRQQVITAAAVEECACTDQGRDQRQRIVSVSHCSVKVVSRGRFDTHGIVTAACVKRDTAGTRRRDRCLIAVGTE
jgi:lysophospholipase L1-like esterase